MPLIGNPPRGGVQSLYELPCVCRYRKPEERWQAAKLLSVLPSEVLLVDGYTGATRSLQLKLWQVEAQVWFRGRPRWESIS